MVQKFLRLDAVRDATGLSRASIYRLIQAGKFPKPLKVLGERVAVWPESEVAEWQRERLAERDQPGDPRAA